MAAPIDTGLEFFRQALALRAYRQEILSADIANASTPGFKAVDLDFAGALNAATSRRPASETTAPSKRIWLVDDPRQMVGTAASAPNVGPDFVKYQADTEVTLDGNSVDLNREKSEAAANAVQYEAAASFTSQIIKMLNTAVGGAAGSAAGGG